MSNFFGQYLIRRAWTRQLPGRIMASLGLVFLWLGSGSGTLISGLHAQSAVPPGRIAAIPPPAAPVPPGAQPAVAAPVAPPQAIPAPAPPSRRFQFTISPDAATKDLLPTPPIRKSAHAVALPGSLAEVPEIEFQAPLAKTLASEEAMKQTAHQLAKINHLNNKMADGFMDALRGERSDLVGLPFAMGDACRIKGDRSKEFTRAVATVRSSLRAKAPPPPPAAAPTAPGTSFSATVETKPDEAPAPPTPPAENPRPAVAVMPAPAPPSVVAPSVATATIEVSGSFSIAVERATADAFWEQYTAACAEEDKQVPAVDRAHQENVLLARVAALMQVLAPEAPSLRLDLVKYLATISHREATRALARLAVFSDEEEVRAAAIAALKVRRERDYTDILLASLRYPWPAVAGRGADALVKLERADLVPQLVALLDEPDPRAPVVKERGGRSATEVQELVRINHHRNCMLCHAPGNTTGVSSETLTASVPVPSDPLPNLFDGYQNTSPDLAVRIDVTYLRQDFSAMQAVADANPWPEMQRFDFLVRTRTLTADEVAAAKKMFAAREPGSPSPYQKAALAALRDLTGRDAGPTSEAWRRMLKLGS